MLARRVIWPAPLSGSTGREGCPAWPLEVYTRELGPGGLQADGALEEDGEGEGADSNTAS